MASNLVSAESGESAVPVYQINDATILLNGEFTRQGFDLVITAANGEQIVVADYFSFNPPPNLMLSSGAGLSPQMVEALLHETFAGSLFAGPAEGIAKVAIGTVVLSVARSLGKALRERSKV